MTKTKSQKIRSKMSRVNVNSNKGKQRAMQREFNFLNGNTLSFLNGVARKKAARQRNIGQQARSQRVNAPTASGFAGLSSKARITTMDSGITRVRHSEFVKDIASSADFTAESFPINPGTSDLFPWLSTIARRFESYQFQDLNIRFETTSPTNTAGTVIITADYNPQGHVPTSKTQALAMESAVRAPTWGSVNHRSLKHNLSKRKSYYVRSPTVGVVDSDLYDTGLAIMMVEGVPLDAVPAVGEMYVDYVVDLITPVLDSDITASDEVKVITETIPSPTDGAFPFEVLVSQNPVDSFLIGVGPSNNVETSSGHAGTVGAFFFNRSGDFMVIIEWKSAGIALTVPNFGWGTRAGVPPSNTISVVNLTPGGAPVMIDASDPTQGVSMFAIRSVNTTSASEPSNLKARFGIGTFDVAGGLGAFLRATIRITDYANGLN